MGRSCEERMKSVVFADRLPELLIMCRRVCSHVSSKERSPKKETSSCMLDQRKSKTRSGKVSVTARDDARVSLTGGLSRGMRHARRTQERRASQRRAPHMGLDPLALAHEKAGSTRGRAGKARQERE